MIDSKGSLREVRESDLERILAWRNSDRIRAQMYTDELITLDQHRSWYEKAIKDPNFCMRLFEYEDRPAGFIHVNVRDPGNRLAYWGFYLGDYGLPRGTGSVMGKLAIRLAFEAMGVRKLIGEVFAFNKPSLRMHEKLGFKREGVCRQHILKNGKYEDIVCFAILLDEYRAGVIGNE